MTILRSVDDPAVTAMCGEIEEVSDRIEALRDELDAAVREREGKVLALWGHVGRGTSLDLSPAEVAALFRGRDGLSKSNIRRLAERGPR